MKFLKGALLWVLMGIPLWAEIPGGSVVSIFSTTKTGEAGLGTGFFIGPNGRVLTCYHVIHGANALKVFVNRQAYSSVEVESIDPDHDLAMLAVRDLRGPSSFLRTQSVSPSAMAAAALETYGYPSVLRDQHLGVKITSNDYLPSQDFRDPATGARLFALRNVDLISVDLTIYNGLSGAPLVHNGEAVGVISGSFQQGGSIAWAIPMKYLGNLKPVGKPASAIAEWPELTLMSSSTSTLRRQVFLGLDLTVALDQYGDAVDGTEREWVAFWSDTRTVPILRKLLVVIDAQIKRWGPDLPTANHHEIEKEWMASAFNNDADSAMAVGKLMEKAGEQLIASGDNFDQLDAELMEALDQYFTRLPQTEKTKSLHQTVNRRLDTFRKSLDEFTAQIPSFDDDDKVTLGDLGKLLHQLLDENLMTDLIHRMREFQDIIESVFEASAARPNQSGL